MAARIERASMDVRGESASAQERSDRAYAGRRRRHERRGKLRLSTGRRIVMRDATASFIIPFIHFPLGALIVAFHNVWQGSPLMLTLIGYGLVMKSLVYFVFPKRGLKTLSRVSIDKSWEFVVGGIFSIGISGLLTLKRIL